MVYEIFEGNFERLEKKLNRIGNKCKKYGCDFCFSVIGETFREVIDESTKEKHIARFITVEVSGTAKVNDWEFVAELEHTENGNIIRGTGIYEIPERYYTGKPVCEHCKSNRFRKNTYIVRNSTTGEFKQVGKSCLMDFTNGLSAEAVASYIAFFEEVIRGEQVLPGGSFERYVEITEFLQYVTETVNKFGYVKKADADYGNESTCSRAISYMMVCKGQTRWMPKQEIERRYAEMEKVAFDANSDTVKKQVQEALECLKQQDESNNYFHNLKVACYSEYTSMRNTGIIASLIPAHFKALETEKERAEREARKQKEASSSKYVGEIGKRISFQPTAIQCLTSWETMYGTTFLYKIIDTFGNVFTWKTSSSISENISSITGTVKNHSVYNGVKQTELTRCRVAA